jgi:hypothetical protein
MRKVLIPLGIDTSLVYAQKIASTKWKSIKTQEDIYQYIANHMNICNYVRLEKADEAVAHFLHHFPDKEICIDTLALVSDEQQTIREYSLSTKTL